MLRDIDAVETREWLEVLDCVLAHDGRTRARYLLERLVEEARDVGVSLAAGCEPAEALLNQVRSAAPSLAQPNHATRNSRRFGNMIATTSP